MSKRKRKPAAAPSDSLAPEAPQSLAEGLLPLEGLRVRQEEQGLLYEADSLQEASPEDPGPVLGLFNTDDTGTTEEIMAKDMAGLQSAFNQRAKLEAKRFLCTVDSEYWFCLSFDTREQKHAFLKALGWDSLGDKYLDGVELAEKLGITIPPTPPSLSFVREKHDSKLDSLT